MATDLGQVRPAPAAKYDAFVDGQIKRARQRIRTLDLTTGLLGFIAGSLAFALGMALCDRGLEARGGLSSIARQLALGSYTVAALVYLAFFVVLPLCRRINPYYAAKQVELALPGAKNSVVNWLDLHDKTLPAAIHGALGQRAARDLSQADLDQVISGKRALWSGVCTFSLFLACVITLLSLGPRKFLSLLERAFAPFSETIIASRTQLTLLRPEGDVTVPVGRSVAFTVRIDGRVPEANKPDAPKLLYRYQPDEPYESQPLEREADREWSAAMPAFQVRTGFWYKVTAGDAETPEYRVTVRSTPFVTSFQVRYHYRPYTGWGDYVTRDPQIKGLRGTEVTLMAHTNRTIKEGRLDMDQGGVKKSIPAAAVSGDREAMRFQFVLEQDGQYRIGFTSEEGESSSDALSYSIEVVRDNAPQVVIRQPEPKEIPLPANGLLQIEGSASDDIGVKNITLRMKMLDGPTLQPKVYGDGKSFKLPAGGYPKTLEYKDFVALDKVKDQSDKPFELKPGMVLEYWLEATDDCDYPKPNVGSSVHKMVRITEPAKDQKQQEQQQKQAEQEKKKHEEQQKQKLDKENEDRKKEEAAKEQQNQANEKNQKPDEQPGKGEDKKPEKGNSEQKPDQGKSDKNEGNNQQQNGEQQARDQKTKEDINKLNREIAKEEQKNQQKGEAKNDCKGECKGDGRNQQPMDQQPGKGKGEGKGQGEKGPNDKAGDSKDGGEAGDKQERAEGKGAGSKDNAPMQQEPAGAAKPEPKDAAKGDDKGPGKGDPAGNPMPKADAKEEGKAAGNQAGAKSEQKPANPDQAKGAGVAKGDEKKEGKPESGATAGAEKSPRDVKPEDLAKLAEQAKGQDGSKKDEAARDLEDLAKNADDPKVREAARKLLEELRKEQQGKEPEPGAAKEGPKPPNGQERKEDVPSAEGKNGGKQEEGASPGEPKKGESDSGNAKQGEPKGEGKEKGQSNAGSGDKREPKEENQQGAAKGREPSKKGERTGNNAENATGNRQGDSSASAEDRLPTTAADLENQKKASALQLEKFKRHAEDEALRKRTGWTKEQYEQLLKDWQALKDRQFKAAEEKLSGPKHGGSLSNIGAHPVTPSDSGKKDDAKAGSAAEAPPGYEEAQRAFTRSLPDAARTPRKP